MNEIDHIMAELQALHEQVKVMQTMLKRLDTTVTTLQIEIRELVKRQTWHWTGMQ